MAKEKAAAAEQDARHAAERAAYKLKQEQSDAREASEWAEYQRHGGVTCETCGAKPGELCPNVKSGDHPRRRATLDRLYERAKRVQEWEEMERVRHEGDLRPPQEAARRNWYANHSLARDTDLQALNPKKVVERRWVYGDGVYDFHYGFWAEAHVIDNRDKGRFEWRVETFHGFGDVNYDEGYSRTLSSAFSAAQRCLDDAMKTYPEESKGMDGSVTGGRG